MDNQKKYTDEVYCIVQCVHLHKLLFILCINMILKKTLLLI